MGVKSLKEQIADHRRRAKKKPKEGKKQALDLNKIIAEEKKEHFINLCKKNNLPAPQPEYHFAKKTIGRNWRIDYYFERDEMKVALEVEGGVFESRKEGGVGRHSNSINGYLNDMEKYNQISVHGIFLIRCIPDKLNSQISLLKKFFK